MFTLVSWVVVIAKEQESNDSFHLFGAIKKITILGQSMHGVEYLSHDM